MAAPYPGLHPDLWDMVRALGPEPPLDISVAQMRADYAAQDTARLRLPRGVEVGDFQLPSKTRLLPLRQFTPTPGQYGAMLYLHGGGWVLGGVTEHDQICADLAAATGLTVISLDYALAPEHPYPAALAEAVSAFDELAGHTDGPFWVGGDSAGGNLALALALKRRDSDAQPPDGVFLAYPCLDPACDSPSHATHAHAPDLSRNWMLRFWADYLGDTTPDIYAAPALDDLNGLPPLVVLTAELDPLVDEGDAITSRATGPVWHEQAKGMIHSFLRYRAQSAAAEAAFQRACAAIKGFNSAVPRDLS